MIFQTDLFFFNLSEFASDRVDLVHLFFHHRIENSLQFCQCDIAEQIFDRDIFFEILNLFRYARLLKYHSAGIHLPVFQFVRSIFIHFIFQDSLDEFLPWILKFFLLFLLYRKKHFRLDAHKCRRHYKKFTHHIHIFRIHLTDIVEILLCDQNNGNIINIHFIFFNQMQQQIQRSFKDLQFNRYSHVFTSSLPIYFYPDGLQSPSLPAD